MVDFMKMLFRDSPPALPSDMTAKINSYYVTTKPSPQNALDILKGEWSSGFPAPDDDLRAGGVPLFEDERIYWLSAEIQGLKVKSVLELGPLEGGAFVHAGTTGRKRSIGH